MNCVEFEHALSDYLKGGQTSERLAHLSTCSTCSGLLSDLSLISSEAELLQESDEPSPSVWNALEAQLRREGIIRHPAVSRPPFADFFLRWRRAWLVPVAAVLVIGAGIKLFRPAKVGDTGQVAKQVTAPSAKPAVSTPVVSTPAVSTPAVSTEDQQILNTVAARPPSQQASYRANLDEANSFIRDAEESLKRDPNDVYTQQLLINAYEQKQMLYDLAVDRSNEEQ